MALTGITGQAGQMRQNQSPAALLILVRQTMLTCIFGLGQRLHDDALYGQETCDELNRIWPGQYLPCHGSWLALSDPGYKRKCQQTDSCWHHKALSGSG